jgi:arginyl-tRNA synthetase
MGKRSGEFVALRDVLSEVGIDAARFFFLIRKSDTHLDFDLDLAKRQSSDNPVFYVQYAHARVASVFAQADRSGIQWPVTDLASIVVERLAQAEEIDLIRKMTEFNDILEDTVREVEPHRMVFYLLELSGEFHRYYNRTRILSEDRELTLARMLLAQTVQSTIRRGLEMLGVDAPMKMASRFDSPGDDGLLIRMGGDRDGGESKG